MDGRWMDTGLGGGEGMCFLFRASFPAYFFHDLFSVLAPQTQYLAFF